jgi:glycosyltransferase involved in cell wall biosynthesis
MASYNGMPYLPTQIESILSQTQPPDEIVVCDDGSSDGTWEYLSDLAAQHRHLRLFRNETRLGAAQNFGRALKYATGDLVFLSDQDDVWLPGKIARMIEFGRQTRASLVMSNGELIDEADQRLPGTIWKAHLIDTETRELLESDRAWETLIPRCYFTGCVMCFSGELARSLPPAPRWSWHDEWIALNAALRFPGTLRLLDESLVLYRQHPGNLVGARVPLIGTLTRNAIRIDPRRVVRELTSFEDVIEVTRRYESVSECFRGLLPQFDAEPIGSALKTLDHCLQHHRRRCSFVAGDDPVMSIFSDPRRDAYARYSRGGTTMFRDLFARMYIGLTSRLSRATH